MKIHEYQADILFSRYKIPVNEGILCKSVSEAIEAYRQLGNTTVVVKAQVLTGGRGKSGGVKVVRSRQELEACAGSILGMKIKEFDVERILVSPAVDIVSEYYLSLTTDRNSRSVVLILSREGGIDIEEVARKNPGKIHRIIVDPYIGVPEFFSRRASFLLFDTTECVKQSTEIIKNLYTLFVDTDASLVEINPLVLTADGKLLAIDAKMSFDDNALYRHPDIRELYQPDEEEKTEILAKSKGISYVNLGGEIGCMVNGAGLAMATMDMIKLYGGNPANFLDIGGSSNPMKVVEAMKILMKDKQVKVVFINIFGGITRCDDVASGLIRALEEIKPEIPVVVRLTGTNEREGLELLQGKPLYAVSSMEEAAQMAVSLMNKS